MVSFGELLRPNKRPYTLGETEDADLVGMRLYGYGPFHRERKPALQIKKRSHFVIKANDVIYNKLFAWKGTFGVVPPEFDGMYVSDKFPTYEADLTRLDLGYLRWYFRCPPLWGQARDYSKGAAALSKLTLNPSDFPKLTIPLAPLPEQRRLVERIDALAGKIEEAKGLQKETRREADAFGHSFLDQVYEDLRSVNNVSKLSDVCSSVTDGAHLTPAFTDQGVKFIFVGNVSSGRLHFNGCKYVTPEYFGTVTTSRHARRGDLLYSAVGATLGIPAVVDSDEDFCFQRHVAIIKPDRSRLDSRYLWYMLRSGTLFRKAWASITGTAQPTVPLRAIRVLPLPVPPMSEQKRIVVHLDKLQTKIETVKSHQEESWGELGTMLPAILNRAFQGELPRPTPRNFLRKFTE